MALVSYGSSDSESDYEESKATETLNNNNNELPLSESNDQKTNEDELHQPNDEFDDQDLKATNFLKLPHPSSTVDKLVSNLTTSKEKGKVKIFLPSYKATDDQLEDDNDEREFKRFKYSSSRGSALKSLLPPPKHKSVKTTSFVPDILKRKAESTTVSRPTNLRPTIKAIDDDDESVNFFTFDQDKNDTNNVEFRPQAVQANKFETDLIHSRFNDRSIKASFHSSSGDDQSNSSSHRPPAQETAYQKERKLKYEIEKKFGEEVGDDVRIQEVNIANHLNDNLDYLKTVSEEREVQVKGPAPSSMAKRKHQITYLAYQAKQNETKLKNEWAQGRINREQSRSKYGF